MSKQANQRQRGGKVNLPSPPRSRLPIYLAVGGAMFVVIAGVALLANLDRGSSSSSTPAQITGQPKLAVAQQKIDFGKVPLDRPIKATFKLSNVGDQPLQILNRPVVEVKQGC